MNPFPKGHFKHTMRFKLGGGSSGGGGGAAAPAGSTVVSTPPPPTAQSVEVQMARREAAKQAAKRKGLQQTVLAGETGGYKPQDTRGATVLGNGVTATQKNTYLGGG